MQENEENQAIEEENPEENPEEDQEEQEEESREQDSETEEVEEGIESEESKFSRENTNSVLDISAIKRQEQFSTREGSRASNSWNKEHIRDLINQLKEQDDGSVRIIPMQWLWENLRKDPRPCKAAAWAARTQIERVSKELGIGMEINQSGCKRESMDGNLEIRFK